jgi:hypothetical protein
MVTGVTTDLFFDNFRIAIYQQSDDQENVIFRFYFRPNLADAVTPCRGYISEPSRVITNRIPPPNGAIAL